MSKRAAFFVATFVIGLASAATAQDACALAPGEKLALDDLDAVLNGLSGTVVEKDAFETNEEFEARKKAAEADIGIRTVVLASNVDQENAVYDADKGAWFLTEYFPSNAIFDFVDDAIESAGLIEDTGYRVEAPFDDEKDRIESVMLRSIDELVGEYDASNAMGGTIAVQKWHHSRVAIGEISGVSKKPRSSYKNGTELFAYVDNVQVKDALGTGFNTLPALRVDMPRDEARAINGQIGFAIVADLQVPARIEGQYFIEPQFDRPAERTIDTTVLTADVRCGIAFGPDFSVLATVQTRPPF